MSEDQEVRQVADLADIADQVRSVVDNPRIKQAIVVMIGDDDEVVEFKGHWYDNAKLMNILVKTYRKRVFRDIFDDTPD